MKVLYVTTNDAPDAATVLADLVGLEPDLEIRPVVGGAGALREIRTGGGYGALLLAPSVPQKEALTLISSVRRDRTPIAIIAITTDAERSFSARASTAGADDVLVFRNDRLIAAEDTLRRVRHTLGVSPEPRRRREKVTAPAASPAELGRLQDELRAAEERTEALSAAAQSATIALATLRADHEQLRESLAFERALRDRDREELARATRELSEERERRVVLEITLSRSEDQARAERDRLKEDVAKAADRLQQVAHNTQTLQTRLERQLSEEFAERDRLKDNALIGHAVFTRDGRLVRCSATFASLLGYASPEDAIQAGRGAAFTGTPDHARIVQQLDRGVSLDRIESTIRHSSGRPIRVITSVTRLPASGGDDDSTAEIERLVVDMSDLRTSEVELLLARRLEAAGRLAAEMAPRIEDALAELENRTEGGEASARDVILLVRQLLAFSRHQAKPAGFLSLNEAVTRSRPVLEQIAGGAIELHTELGQVEPVTAGEEDIEHLLIEVVSAAASCLPFGGRLTLATSSEMDSRFVLRTALTATAAGYGVLPCTTSPSLVRHAARCGGSLQVSGETGRSSTLHVHLPC